MDRASDDRHSIVPPPSHCDGGRFRNEEPAAHASFGGVLRWMATRKPGPWPLVDGAPPGQPPPARVRRGQLRVTYVNHATVLIQMDGINVLTDPIWSERCSPLSWAGPKRVRPPGIRFDDLPPIDLVLLSHDHYDHLDLPTLSRLRDASGPAIVCGLGNGAFLADKGIGSARELDWWESTTVTSEVTVTAVPAQHFSGRGLVGRDRTLWAGFVLTGPAGAVYFAGDTGFGPQFAQIAERFGPMRLALLPIGAYRPEWFMARVHCSPDDALRAHEVLGAGTSVGIHFGTFRLADDGRSEAPEHIAALLAEAPEPRPRFWVLGFGKGREVPDIAAVQQTLPLNLDATGPTLLGARTGGKT